MQISKNSWHYKLNKSMIASFEVDVLSGRVFTTCSYIWLMLLSVLQATLFTVAGIGILLFAAAVVSGMIGVPIALLLGLKFGNALIINVLGIGLLGWIITGIITFIFLAIKSINYIGEWNTKREHKRRAKTSLAKQALKDRKDGICTIVTFK